MSLTDLTFKSQQRTNIYVYKLGTECGYKTTTTRKNLLKGVITALATELACD
jgi:hypothetical protein